MKPAFEPISRLLVLTTTSALLLLPSTAVRGDCMATGAGTVNTSYNCTLDTAPSPDVKRCTLMIDKVGDNFRVDGLAGMSGAVFCFPVVMGAFATMVTVTASRNTMAATMGFCSWSFFSSLVSNNFTCSLSDTNGLPIELMEFSVEID